MKPFIVLRKRQHLCLSLILSTLFGCHINGVQPDTQSPTTGKTAAQIITNHHQDIAVIPTPRNSFAPAYTHKALNDYAEQMTMELLSRTKDINPGSKVAIASFVELNHNLKTSSILGNQLAESFIPELQSYGLSIVDFKATSAISVTPNGDLFFERSGPRGEMNFVLTGTLKRNGRGVEVSARIINIQDKVVVATAKGFIPHFIVSSLSPDYFLLDDR